MSVREFEPFVVPGLPHRIEITKAQLPNAVNIVAQTQVGHKGSRVSLVQHFFYLLYILFL